MKKIKVVVIGGGFAGVSAIQQLAHSSLVEVLLIDRRNYHLFQPLLYQVAMAGLSPADISVPLRTLFSKNKNVNINLSEVEDVDVEKSQVRFDNKWTPYDYLILACGAKHAYFGNEKWEEVAPGLKNIEQALEIRRRVLIAFEHAEKETDPVKQKAYLTFVVVGGGPTGVELAGAISEMARHTLMKDFKKADLKNTSVILVEAGPRLLAGFPEALSDRAAKDLCKMGVDVRLNTRASALTQNGLHLGDTSCSASTIIWAAGVQAASLTSKLPVEKDKIGRAIVSEDLSLPTHKNVFVAGDQAHLKDSQGKILPGIAPVAIQQGRHAAEMILRDQKGKSRLPFRYHDKGIMATIGRSKAVASTAGLQFGGWIAWLAWAFIHVIYLIRFRNRFFVFLQWTWSYFTFGRGARLITHRTWKFYSGEKVDLE